MTSALLVAHPRISVLPLDGREVAVGRAELGTADEEVSSRHATLTRAGDGHALVDLRSRNGTFVNGARLEAERPMPLVDGDIVRMGSTLAVFREGDRADPAPPPDGHGGPFGQGDLELQLRAISRRRRVSFVLVQGETGSGKESAARQVGARLRPRGPLLVTNLAQLAPGSFQSQLFGHARGAFTSAVAPHRGLLVDAGEGALVLDELTEIPLEHQAALLRALENSEITPVGGAPRRHAALVIGTTNRDLPAAVASGALRADLAARLSMAAITVAPLRARAEDIPSIAGALVARDGLALDAEVEAMEHLMRLPLLDNARGLARVLSTAVGDGGRLRQRDVERVAGAPPPLDLSRVHAGAYASDRQLARAAGVSRRQAMKKKRATP